MKIIYALSEYPSLSEFYNTFCNSLVWNDLCGFLILWEQSFTFEQLTRGSVTSDESHFNHLNPKPVKCFVCINN